ncbi:uncharacterized protein LOC105775429 [Gossypium raimondii]|uniref:uncharacterized protein LOC105775429 n=1 Tax=Gossypium raimondii TaxID=29730 RepID=UPI00063AB1F8|nr:uncharacterized protein LOC105775429 [Gossypium raimondii]
MAANTNSLSLRSVLEKDKVNSLNFLNLFLSLRIVLKQERKLYAIEQPLPNEPPSNASRVDRDVYNKHLDDMVDIRCLMLATMNPNIQKPHKDMVSYDMIEHLEELYQGRKPIGPHVLKMIGYIESLSKLGFPLSQELAIDVILQSFPDSYSHMLRTTESNMKKTGPKPIVKVCNNKGKGKAKPKTKPKGKGRPKSKNGKATLKPKGGVAKEGNCFHCGVIGHWKRNCPVYLEEVKKAKES